jgi:broad specificity polyphosphatase/5'/3'-nucleotidase SurE
MSKPTILVTNDDGVSAPGLRALVEAMTDFGTVVVVALQPQSGMDVPLLATHCASNGEMFMKSSLSMFRTQLIA